VLGVRAVVLQEAQDLDKMLRIERERVELPPLGDDPVSKDMSREFNAVTKQLLDRAQQHVGSLFGLCDELAATAQTYGRTESDIEASFGPNLPRTTASRVSPAPLEAIGMGATAARPPAQSFGVLITGGQV
jgi:hypothetical protein